MGRLGFIGLGTMGAPMAGHLIGGGHQVHLHTRRGVPDRLTSAGGIACSTAAEVAAKSDIIFLMAPDTPHAEDVLFGQAGIAGELSPGKTVVDMSLISPIATRDLARRINDLGCDYLDAPVSGGEVGAKAGTLTIMCGGPNEAFERVKPLFELMGKNIALVGGNGDGQVCKAANQIIVAQNIEAVGEVPLFASKAGAEPTRVREALPGGFASSKILEVHGERMIKRTFDPGFWIELHQRDLNLALSNARKAGIALPNTATAHELLNVCASSGGSARDHSAMVRALEIMASNKVA